MLAGHGGLDPRRLRRDGPIHVMGEHFLQFRPALPEPVLARFNPAAVQLHQRVGHSRLRGQAGRVRKRARRRRMAGTPARRQQDQRGESLTGDFHERLKDYAFRQDMSGRFMAGSFRLDEVPRDSCLMARHQRS